MGVRGGGGGMWTKVVVCHGIIPPVFRALCRIKHVGWTGVFYDLK